MRKNIILSIAKVFSYFWLFIPSQKLEDFYSLVFLFLNLEIVINQNQ